MQHPLLTWRIGKPSLNTLQLFWKTGSHTLHEQRRSHVDVWQADDTSICCVPQDARHRRCAAHAAVQVRMHHVLRSLVSGPLGMSDCQ